jgi:Flp pilus assembly protein TadD
MSSGSAICLLLVVSVLAVYSGVIDHRFINFDDPEYVYANERVCRGLTLSNVAWAFTTFTAANWHPLTWLSHMLDVDLFGLNPAGHHLTNLLLHAANTLLLFSVLRRASATLWKPAIVAALFAVHPLHVESVVWVAERKDVLSTFWGLVAIRLSIESVIKGRKGYYLLCLASFALSLLSKPMLVTLPFLLLLLDYRPLGERAGDDRPTGACGRMLAARIIGKLPLLVMSLLSSVVTLYAQRHGKALLALSDSSLAERLANVPVACLGYIGKTFWPVNLAPLYDFRPVSLPQALLAGTVIIGITVFAVVKRKRYPWLLFGWLWYLITLLPVIGIVRVGSQSMADRYTYIPLVGIFIILVWAGGEIAGRSPRRRGFLAVLTVSTLLLLGVAARRQALLWRDDSTLYSHALTVEPDNWIMHNNLGFALEEAGKTDEAIGHYREAIRIAPGFAKAYVNLGACLNKLGRVDEAVELLRQAAGRVPDPVPVYVSLASLLSLNRQPARAVEYLNEALALEKGVPEIYLGLGYAYGALGEMEQAAAYYRKGLALDPDRIDCRYNLAVVLMKLGRNDEAAGHFRKVLQLGPDREMESFTRKFLDTISAGGAANPQ